MITAVRTGMTPKDVPDRARAYFLLRYARLAERGRCDSAGGMECERVYQEWVAFDYPGLVLSYPTPGAPLHATQRADHGMTLDQFIVWRANLGPYQD